MDPYAVLTDFAILCILTKINSKTIRDNQNYIQIALDLSNSSMGLITKLTPLAEKLKQFKNDGVAKFAQPVLRNGSKTKIREHRRSFFEAKKVKCLPLRD